ncbi:hypothetical protein GFV12_04895 [Desulfurobacterium thermolithotrophum]|uniref:hypothetical protein n=1 Tax=Desulfurobacterium thermolithotrophum TaxID=64160 RepID=UPI0013D6B9D4|nr:hypothetical protein [Desulfurobacterium thermolithotrophum]
MKPNKIIKISGNKQMQENFEKTIINGVLIDKDKKYFWNDRPGGCNTEEDSILLFLDIVNNNGVLVRVKRKRNNDKIYQILKKIWKDEGEIYRRYIELEKLMSFKNDQIKEVSKKIFKGQTICRNFDDLGEEIRNIVINWIDLYSKNRNLTKEDLSKHELREEITINTEYSVNKLNCFSKKLNLDQYIIKSFYNSLKTKGFVILAGLSGTGKTKIFEEFVKCFPELKSNSKLEKWIALEYSNEKLIRVKKEEIEFNNGKIKLKDFIDSINESLDSTTGRKVYLKIANYYTYLVPVVEKLKEKTHLINASGITNHLATYIACIFGFEVIENSDIKKLNLKQLDKPLKILEVENKMENNLFFPIRPDFKDTKSLLGFYNPLKETYHSTPLLEFILRASKNYLEKGKEADPFFVLFDEMNLARVEYYFADFLSILETKRFESKDEVVNNYEFKEFIETLGFNSLREDNFKFTSQSIKLHSEKIEDIPQELFLPPNLYFVGTVNIDETTHMFSPKVLDRAFTIEFDVGNFEEYLKFLKDTKEESDVSEKVEVNLKEDFINEGKFAVIDKEKIREFVDTNKDILKKLEQINSTLKIYNLHFGYRVFDEIVIFLHNSQNSLFKFENLDEAFDLAIKMKVLPKFHGTRQRLWEPILSLLKVLDIKEKVEETTDAQDNNSDGNQTNDNFGEQNKKERKNFFDEISEKLDGIPKVIKKGNELYLKLKLEEEYRRIETPYIHTTHKLLEMLYKLKSQGFASFI